MSDRPDARELVEAVATWLDEELAPRLEGGARFQALVAGQALAIACRELALAAGHAEADAEMLAAFGVADAAGLCAAIRHGEHDGDLAALTGPLRAHVRRKLAVARPGYDAPG